MTIGELLRGIFYDHRWVSVGHLIGEYRSDGSVTSAPIYWFTYNPKTGWFRVIWGRDCSLEFKLGKKIDLYHLRRYIQQKYSEEVKIRDLIDFVLQIRGNYSCVV